MVSPLFSYHSEHQKEPRNPFKIAEKILRSIANPEEAKRMGINGRKIVLEKFKIEKHVDDILPIFGQLLRK